MRPADRLEARAGVEQPDEARPPPAEVAREEERVVLADDAVGRVRAVEPVHADAHHRVVDGPELLDGLVRLREEPGHAVRRPAEATEGGLELHGGLLDAGERELVGLRARVAGPEDGDLLGHGAELTRAAAGEEAQEPEPDQAVPPPTGSCSRVRLRTPLSSTTTSSSMRTPPSGASASTAFQSTSLPSGLRAELREQRVDEVDARLDGERPAPRRRRSCCAGTGCPPAARAGRSRRRASAGRASARGRAGRTRASRRVATASSAEPRTTPTSRRMTPTCRCDSSWSCSYGIPTFTAAHSRCCIASTPATSCANALAVAPGALHPRPRDVGAVAAAGRRPRRRAATRPRASAPCRP